MKKIACIALLALTPLVAIADDVYNPATHVLTAPVVSVDGQNYTNANILLGADGRWSLLEITPPSASASVAEKCTTANINLTNYKRITKGMDLVQVTSIIGCNPENNVIRSSSGNTYYWYMRNSYGDATGGSITVYFDPNDRNAGLISGRDL